jgi:hypothetical protein
MEQSQRRGETPEKLPAPGSQQAPNDNGRFRWNRTLTAAAFFLSAATLALVARILFLRWGILYGASPVSHIDAMIGAVFAVGIAFAALGWKGRRDTQLQASEGSPSQRWTDWVSGITALIGAATLVISLMNLLEPLNPPTLAKSACPGARDSNVPYVGITSGVDGDNSREGPARAYPANGRFPADCSVGFSVYCLGDPISDETGSTPDETWVTSRWLVVAKQPDGWRSAAARVLSGENSQPQFVSDAFVIPETSYSRLPLGRPSQCPGTVPYPSKVRLLPFDPTDGVFTAEANYAANIGFAVWVPPHQGFINGNSYLQIFTQGTGPTNNPGETDSAGVKTAEWSYKQTLLPLLQNAASGQVIIMAVPCLADNVPARTSTAALSAYTISPHARPARSASIPGGFNPTQMARAACEAHT